MIKRKLLIITSTLVIALLVVVGTVIAAGPDARFNTHLTGGPAGTDSQGQGQANFMLRNGELRFIVTTSVLSSEATLAHIHISAEPGGNGPPAVTLCGGGPPPMPNPLAACNSPGVLASGSIDLTQEQIDNLLTAIAEGRAYVNVHSVQHPPGEIRGELGFIGG